MGRLAWIAVSLGLVLLATLAWSYRLEIGLPRIALSVESPEGRDAAVVRNHPEIDPPNQSIWLERADESPQLIERLAPDQDWCDEVIWSEGGTLVAFVISDARLLVVEAASGRTLFDDRVLEPPFRYSPGSRITGLKLTSDAAEFRTCTRAGECSPLRTLDLAAAGGAA